jgi:hypothetical protein
MGPPLEAAAGRADLPGRPRFSPVAPAILPRDGVRGEGNFGPGGEGRRKWLPMIDEAVRVPDDLTVTPLLRSLELPPPRIHQPAGTSCSGGPGSSSDRSTRRGGDMLRLPAAAAVFLGCVLSAATCPAAGQDLPADNKKPWQETELKRFQGRWTALREEKTDQEGVRRREVELEFGDGRVKITILDEKRNQTWSNSLQVIGVEQVGPVSRLVLGSGEQKKAEVYYDFAGDKMILVGRIIPRPFEGFSLSGEYRRPAKRD